MTMELVREYWREVGIDLRLKSVERRLQSERAQANKMQMTLWHADKVTDILFPLVPDWFYPHRSGWDIAHVEPLGALLPNRRPTRRRAAAASSRTCHSGATNCARRPPRSTAPRPPRPCLKPAAENLWTIGTVGQAPHPVVVSNRLKNVTLNRHLGLGQPLGPCPTTPATWYFDEDEP